jgi:hypothetical protein
MVSNLERRLERLEEKLTRRAEPRVMITTNVRFGDGEEDPYTVKIAPGLWAIAARGGPFTPDEIKGLKEKHRSRCAPNDVVLKAQAWCVRGEVPKSR